MTVKPDPPPSEPPSTSSDAGETTSLLSHPMGQPPTYQDSTAGEHSQAALQHQLYPTIPAARSTSMPAGPSPFHSLPMPAAFSHDEAMRAADKRARKRFFWALFWACVIWITLGVLTGGIVIDESKFRRRYRRPHLPVRDFPTPTFAFSCNDLNPDRQARIDSGFRLPMLREIIRLFPSSTASDPSTPTLYDPTTSSSTSFVFPLAAADTLFFHTQGSSTRGAVEFLIDPTIHDDHVIVDVFAHASSLAMLDHAEVCQARGKNKRGYTAGISIWMPDEPSYHGPGSPSFDVVFRIPAPLTSFASLNVSCPLFGFKSAAVPYIHNVEIVTANAPIQVDHLNGTTIFLKTTNGLIDVGSASAKEWIKGSTTNKRITGTWTSPQTSLSSRNGNVMGSFNVLSSLDIETTNAQVDAAVSLVGDRNFDVKARTTNSKINVTYVKQPKSSFLNSDVSTSNSLAVVKHNVQFEGAFDFSTTNSPVSIDGPGANKDQGRQRQFIIERARVSGSAGKVWWEGDEDQRDPVSRGTSRVSTTNSRVDVQFA